MEMYTILMVPSPPRKFKRDLPPLCLEIRHLGGLQLQLKLIRDKGDEFGIRGFSLGIADSIAEKALQGIQVTSVPGHFDGVADRPLHSRRCGLEGLGHLGIEDFRDRVSLPAASKGCA